MFTRIKNTYYTLAGKYPVHHLVSVGDGILSVFTSTIKQLKEHNRIVDKAMTDRSLIIAKLNDERDILNSVINTNENVISKIEKLFE